MDISYIHVLYNLNDTKDNSITFSFSGIDLTDQIILMFPTL